MYKCAISQFTPMEWSELGYFRLQCYSFTVFIHFSLYEDDIYQKPSGGDGVNFTPSPPEGYIFPCTRMTSIKSLRVEML